MTMPEMIPVESSNLASIGFEVETHTLYITFKGGKTYMYENVPKLFFDELKEAESVGKYFNQNIKNKFVTRIV